MPARTTDPKIPVGTGVSAELFVAMEDYCRDNDIMRGEKPNLSGLLLIAAADKVGFNLPVVERQAAQKPDPEEAKKRAREAEARRREEARKRVEAIRKAGQKAAAA